MDNAINIQLVNDKMAKLTEALGRSYQDAMNHSIKNPLQMFDDLVITLYLKDHLSTEDVAKIVKGDVI